MAVQLRTKKLKGGKISYYLDIYHNGRRSYEFLKIYTSPSDTTTKKKEKKQLAEKLFKNDLCQVKKSLAKKLQKH